MKNEVRNLAARMGRECIVTRLRRVNRGVSALYDAALRPLDLTAARLNILAVIAYLEKAEAGEICRALELEKSSLSRNLEKMHTRGWLEYHPGRDGRSHRIALSRRGAHLLLAAEQAWNTAQEQAAEMLGREGVRALGDLTAGGENAPLME